MREGVHIFIGEVGAVSVQHKLQMDVVMYGR